MSESWNTIDTDLLLIGGGVAGCMAANDPELIAEQKKKRQVHLPSHGDDEQKKIAQITAASQGIKLILKKALESIQ